MHLHERKTQLWALSLCLCKPVQRHQRENRNLYKKSCEYILSQLIPLCIVGVFCKSFTFLYKKGRKRDTFNNTFRQDKRK